MNNINIKLKKNNIKINQHSRKKNHFFCKNDYQEKLIIFVCK